MSGLALVSIPGGYGQLLVDHFLNRFIHVDDNFFRFIPTETHNQPWMFTCSIIQYGDIRDEWVIEFDIYYNSDNLLRSFVFTGYLPYLYDYFMEEIKNVNDQYTISCDNCYTYVTLEYSEENPICPNCGYGLHIKSEPNFTRQDFTPPVPCIFCGEDIMPYETECSGCGMIKMENL